MTLHSLTGTRIYFSSPQHRRLNGIIIEREFLMALDDLIKCRCDLPSPRWSLRRLRTFSGTRF